MQCRDCKFIYTPQPDEPRRCPRCGHPRRSENAMKTYTVKANDFLLGVRLPRKRAIDLLFAASIGANDPVDRDDILWVMKNERVPAIDLANGVTLTWKRDD